MKDAHGNRYLIGDSALYSEETISLLSEQQQLFITRVPQKIKQVKDILNNLDELTFNEITASYSGHWVDSTYGNVAQKWLVIKSEQAYKREIITLDKRIKKNSTEALKSFDKLARQTFGCESDATKALEQWKKKHPFILTSDEEIVSSIKYAKSGRPKKGDEGISAFSISARLSCLIDYREKEKKTKGVFLLATNDCSGEIDMQSLLENYKSQQSVERGFRFLKSPDFLTSSLFLKKPERIEALLMIMTSCLMIYAALEHLIRKQLKETDNYFPCMKNKPTQKPTARWVFQCFGGIEELTIEGEKTIVLNLKPLHEVILNSLGHFYWDFYS